MAEDNKTKTFAQIPINTSGNWVDLTNQYWATRGQYGKGYDKPISALIARENNLDPDLFWKSQLEDEKKQDEYKTLKAQGNNPNPNEYSGNLLKDETSWFTKYKGLPFRVASSMVDQAAEGISDLGVKLANIASIPPQLLYGNKDAPPELLGDKIKGVVSQTYNEVNEKLHESSITKAVLDSKAGKYAKEIIDPVQPFGVEGFSNLANYVVGFNKINKRLPNAPKIKLENKKLEIAANAPISLAQGTPAFIFTDLALGDKDSSYLDSLEFLKKYEWLTPLINSMAISEEDNDLQKLTKKIQEAGITGTLFNAILKPSIFLVRSLRGLRKKDQAIKDDKVLEYNGKEFTGQNIKEIKVKEGPEGKGYGWEINMTEPITIITDKAIASPTSIWKRFLSSNQGFDTKTYRAFEKLEGSQKALAMDLTRQNASFNNAIKNVYGQSLSKLPDETIAIINKALGDNPNIGINAPEIIQKLLKKKNKKYTNKDKEILSNYFDDIAIQGRAERDKALLLLPKPLRKEVLKMRLDVDKYTDDILETGMAGKTTSITLNRNKGLYITTDYKMFSNAQWVKDIKKALVGKGDKNSEAFAATLEAKLLLKQSLPKDTSNQTIENILTQYVNNLKPGPDGILDMLLLSKSTAMQTNKTYGKILNNRKNIDEAFVKILGKEKDPLIRYNNTIKKMSNITSEYQFLSTIKSIAESKYGSKLFTVGDPNNAKNLNQSLASLASSYIRNAGPNANPVAQVFTTPLYNKYLNEGIELAKSSKAWSPYYAVNSLVNSNVTTGSIVTHGKNTMGNNFFLAFNGNLGPSVFKNFGPLIKTLRKKDYADVDMMKFFASNGLINSGVKAQTIIRNLDEVVANPNGWWKKLSKPLDYLGSAYSLEDDVFKILSFMKEKARYKKALPNAPESELNLLAVEVVKNTMPTYHKLIRPIKYLRRVPFATFPAFTAEVFRATAGTARQAMFDINLGIKTNNAGLREAGYARLAGITSSSIALGGHIQYQKLRHDIKPDDIVALDSIAQDWQKNDIVDYDSNIHINSKGELEVKIKNLTSVLPHAPIIQISSAIHAYIMSDQGKQDLENGNLNNFDKIISALKETTSVFTDESLLASGIADIYRGETKQGRSLYKPEDGYFMRRGKDAVALGKDLAPLGGTIKTGVGIYKASRSEKINNARREGYGVTDKGWNNRLEDKVKSLSGAKFDAINISKSFQSVVNNRVASMRAADKNITSFLNDSYNIDWQNKKETDKITQQFLKKIEYSYKQQKKLANLFNDFKKLKYYKTGKLKKQQVDDEFINKLLNDSGVKKENKTLLNALDQDRSGPTVGLYMSPSIKESFDNLIKNQNVPEEILLQLEGILQKFKGTPLLNK